MTNYYEPPVDEQFNELKEKAIELWKEVDSCNDMYGYATGKINCIKDLENTSDNFMYIVTMFDINNRRKLAKRLTEETKKSIRERMLDGGNPPQSIVF